MKRLLPIILSLVLWIPASAQNMTIENRDGQSTAVDMEQLRKLTFQDGTMTVTQENGQSASFNTSGIERLKFGSTTKVETVKAIDGKVEYSAQGLTAVVHDSKDQTISIFNLSGKSVLEQKITQDIQEISLSGLSKGVYLLKLGNRTVKIVL